MCPLGACVPGCMYLGNALRRAGGAPAEQIFTLLAQTRYNTRHRAVTCVAVSCCFSAGPHLLLLLLLLLLCCAGVRLLHLKQRSKLECPRMRRG